MKRWFADTLFKRLFLLMWVALLISHLAAVSITRPYGLGFLFPEVLTGNGPGPGPRPRDFKTEEADSAVPPQPTAGRPLPSQRSAVEGVPGGGPYVAPGESTPGPFPNRFDEGPDFQRDFPVDLPPGARRPGGPRAPSTAALVIDFFVRLTVIGMAAWLGARWLADPMHRLAEAAQTLTRNLGSRRRPPRLKEDSGTLEVRQTAHVFNAMSNRLHEQFTAQTLLMASISHDLRTPLARLRLRLEQMDPTPLQERCISDVREMDQLIASTMDMLRLGHDTVPAQRVDLDALLQSMTDDLIEQGQPVGYEPPVSAEPAALVMADTTGLQRVIGNLVGNAIRHGGNAQVSLQVQPQQVQVQIDDNGPGIPDAELESVFQPFYRVDSSRSRQTGGNGLGLYIARDMAQRHGGTLVLTNRQPHGLRATLTLPRAVS